MSLEKIAQEAQVSKSTVSKVMSGSSEISSLTKEKVISAAKKLGFFEKYYKLRINKKIVAIICPELKSEFYNTIVSYLESKLTEFNYTTVISITNFCAKSEMDLISLHVANNASGIIVLEAQTKVLSYAEVPIVVLNPLKEQENCDSVSTDFYSPIFEAIYHFKKNGHKKIGYVGESLTNDKLQLFYKSMKQHRLAINPDYIIISSYRFETAGYTAMEDFIKNKKRPTAILAAYDYIALGIIQSLRANNLSMPEDLSLVGIDDISFGAFYNISLSSIKSNTANICDLLLEILFKKIDNKYYKMLQAVTVKSSFILRDSIRQV